MTEGAADRVSAGVPELLDRMDRAAEALERVIRQAENGNLSGSDSAGWTAKDHLAHIEAWERYSLAVIERRSPAASLGIDFATYQSSDDDTQNEIIREATKSEPWATILDDLRHTRERLRASVAQSTAADLERPVSALQPIELAEDETTLAGWIDHICDEHVREHIAYIDQLMAR